MTAYRYQVFYSHTGSVRPAEHTQVTTVHQLNTDEGRAEAERELTDRGFDNPKIHAYGLLGRADQEKQS